VPSFIAAPSSFVYLNNEPYTAFAQYFLRLVDAALQAAWRSIRGNFLEGEKGRWAISNEVDKRATRGRQRPLGRIVILA